MTWVWLGVFVACALVDLLWIFWTKSARLGRAAYAAFYSALIQVVGVVSLLLVIRSYDLISANVLGHAFGSYLGVVWSRRKDDFPVAKVHKPS